MIGPKITSLKYKDLFDLRKETEVKKEGPHKIDDQSRNVSENKGDQFWPLEML